MKYLRPGDIKNSKNELIGLQRHISWDIRSGKILELVNRYLPKRNSVILDCASGSGAFLTQMAEGGYSNICGLDIDDYRFPETQKFTLKTADVCLEPIPWPDRYFDAVTSLQTIEHLENPHYFAREVHRVLKPQGILIISTPNPFHILNRLLFLRRGDIYHFLEHDNHITFFTRAIFKKTFLTKFRLLETDYYKPEFKFGGLNKLKFIKKVLPANQWFSRYMYFVLQKSE